MVGCDGATLRFPSAYLSCKETDGTRISKHLRTQVPPDSYDRRVAHLAQKPALKIIGWPMLKGHTFFLKLKNRSKKIPTKVV